MIVLELTKPNWSGKIAGFLATSVIAVSASIDPTIALKESEGSNYQARRPVTMADAIAMTRLDVSSGGLPIQFSPDGSKVVVVLRKGNLATNTNQYSLLMWGSSALLHPSSPIVLLTLSSDSNRGAIANVKWLNDNETLVFLGEHPGEMRQLYMVNTRTRIVTQLTHHSASVLAYTMSPAGDMTAYTADTLSKSIFDDRARQSGLVVSTQPLSGLIAGTRNNPDWKDGRVRLFLKKGANPSRQIAMSEDITTFDEPFVSPDGKHIIIRAIVRRFPAIWNEYSDSDLREQVGWVARFELIDTMTGKSRILLDSPIRSLSTLVAWAPNSRSVVLGGVYLPLDNTLGDERRTRQTKTFIVEVDINSGKMLKVEMEESFSPGIAWYDRKTLTWDATKGCLIYSFVGWNQPDGSESRVYLRKSGDEWQRASETMPISSRPQVTVEEDMNTPPMLYATDQDTHKKVLLLDLNPQFKNLTFARVEEIQWKQSQGEDAKGGLYYPVKYIPGKRYPLVVQTHGWAREKFWIDGPYTTAFAAQTLAGNDVMVLQLDEVSKDMPDEEEMKREVSVYESAVDYLDGRGLIDRDNVGLIGFSRTCLSVKYALAHSTYHFAAASVTDGLDAGYVQFLERFNAGRYFVDFSEGLNGGVPYGKGIGTWVARAPGFNLDKVRTPVRIVALHPGSALGEWEWFAGLSILHKPVEMIILQDGTHVLEKPADRMISQQGSVDWFCFWLKGEEDPDPAKAEQYSRWHELRGLLEESSKLQQQTAPVH